VDPGGPFHYHGTPSAAAPCTELVRATMPAPGGISRLGFVALRRLCCDGCGLNFGWPEGQEE
jgi:hypothetical protein